MDLGTFDCPCCCGSPQVFSDHNCTESHMRCRGCSCTAPRQGSASQLILRIQVAGLPTLALVEQAAELARYLGAPDEVRMRAVDAMPYFEVSGAMAISALELHKMREESRRSGSMRT